MGRMREREQTKTCYHRLIKNSKLVPPVLVKLKGTNHNEIKIAQYCEIAEQHIEEKRFLDLQQQALQFNQIFDFIILKLLNLKEKLSAYIYIYITPLPLKIFHQ